MPPRSSPSPKSPERPGPLVPLAGVDVIAGSREAFETLKPLIEATGVAAQMPSKVADEIRPGRFARRCTPPQCFMSCAVVSTPLDLLTASEGGWDNIAYVPASGVELSPEAPWEAVTTIFATTGAGPIRKLAKGAEIVNADPAKAAKTLIERYGIVNPFTAEENSLGDWGGAPLPA